MTVPVKWQWLQDPTKGIPKLVLEGLKEYGTVEAIYANNNSKILRWADEVAAKAPSTYNNWAADYYNKDSIPWCGLFVALLCVRTGRTPVNSYLSAMAWTAWGVPVAWRNANGLLLDNIWTGDIAVFSRDGGGHVGIVIGVSKDSRYIYVLGGNQDNMVHIKMFTVGRLYSVRRPAYRVRPIGARHLRLSVSGTVSTYEQ